MHYLKSRRLWIALAIVALAIPTVNLFSQPPVQPVIRKKTIAAFQRLSWFPNSISFSFEDLSLSDEKWVQYDLESRQISESTVRPFLPPISEIEGAIPNVKVDQIQFVYSSPNQRYLIYDAPASAGQWDDGRNLIALTDLQTNETVIINLPVSVWVAKWNNTNTAFAIETTITSGNTVVFYFSNFHDVVSQVHHRVLTDEDVVLNSGEDVASGLYAISNDGKSVLLRGYGNISMWDSTGSPNISSFADNIIFRAATFTPDDSGAFYLTKTGMFRYDFTTKQTTPVALKAGTELLQNTVEGSISPDGKHVAIIVRDNAADDYALYVLEVAQGQ